MSKPLVGYIVVGGIGFCVDGGLMTLMNVLFMWSPFEARLVSFPAAVTVTWILNRNWTFGQGEQRVSHKRYLPYLVVQVIGAAINLGVFAILVYASVTMADMPIVALGFAAALSLVFTYSMSRRVIFKTTPP